MSSESSVVEYVIGSDVRTRVLLGIADDGGRTCEMLDESPASESAVYNALSALEERGVIHTDSDGAWELTGLGRIVADVVVLQKRTGSLLSTDLDYWQNHDVSALPAEFRANLSALDGCEIVRATETDPHRVVRKVGDVIESAATVDVVAPVYDPRHERAIEAAAETCHPRLVLNSTVVEEQLDPSEEPPEAPDGIDVRVSDVSFALGITDDRVLLSLPTADGSYDARTEIVADTAAARNWSERLFAHCWETATPAAEYLEAGGAVGTP